MLQTVVQSVFKKSIFFRSPAPFQNWWFFDNFLVQLGPVGIYVLPIDVLLTFAISTSSKKETLVVDFQFEF